jgi:dipeptidyl aminopeptidase/acylaminoacyl peptidase
MSRTVLAAVFLAGCATTVVSAAPLGEAIRNVAGKDVEALPDGSSGRVMEFRAADGSFIPAYLRRPQGSGSSPIIVMLHGGVPNPGITYALGRTSTPPTADFVAAGWAVMVIDYKPNPTVPTTDREDAMAAIEAVRHLPLIDGGRVALFGGSHGGSVISRLASRVDVRCAVMCSPAVLDLIEISKAIDRGTEVAGVLKKMAAAAPEKYGATLEKVARNPAKYGYESALLEAGQVRFPVMIVNGRNDTSAPIAVSQAYVDRLKSAGKEVESYFPDDGLHGFYFGFLDNREGKPANVTPETREAARRATIFIRKYFQ